MPSLSPTMEQGKIVKWVKKEGEEIRRGDVIAEIETDKAAMEYESEEEGRLGKIVRGEGEEVKVGEVIGLLLEKGESEEVLSSYKASGNAASAVNQDNAKTVAQENTQSVKQQDVINKPISTTSSVTTNLQNNQKIFISPLAKVIAKQNNVDISKVKGSGPNGRIIKADIESYLKGGASKPIQQSSMQQTSLGQPEFTDIPNSSMRKTIAKRLLESKITIPHYYLNLECQVDELLKARAVINDQGKDKYKISINDFIIKAVALAMRDVPLANSYWQEDVTRQFNRQDISVAVAIPNGLITPIIKDAANKGLIAISNEMKDLAKRAKDGKLRPEEYQGGGFSISNLGMFGIDSFSAIINPPQSGILAVGAVQKKPIVVKDTIVIGNVLSLVLSADHRTMDGAVGATFLSQVKKYLETPANMLL